MRLAALLLLLAGYGQEFRPQFHFSPEKNWTNDPNGLVYFDGEYHLFFQYNPFGDQWGHMSWGHAVSPDLVHWKELPVALNDNDGIMIFTGSTVVDEHNTSGFCTGGKPCMVAIYTGHTPEAGARKTLQTQNLAYSNDRGRTWTKFKGNPVLDLHMTDFRDPHVFWSEQARRWIMSVALPNERKVRAYGSPDLKKWEQLSDFGPAGATGGQWECPNLFEAPVEGTGERRWVMKIGLNPGGLQGGSGEQYFVGQFDGIKFVNENPAPLTLWTDSGKDCYCALTFNNLPRGQNPVMLGWMNNWQYAGKIPTSPWRGQMTVPRRVALRKTAEGIRLVQVPAQPLEQLRQKPEQYRAKGVVEINRNLKAKPVEARTFDMQATIDPGSAQGFGWKLLTGGGSYLTAWFDVKKQEFYVDRTHAGVTDFSKDFPARTAVPLKLGKQALKLRVLVDRSSVEVFAMDGEVAITNLVFPKSGAGGIEFFEEGGTSGAVSATVWSLRSAW